MKKLLAVLCYLPALAFATETGESCSKIEDNAKRLECYDTIFITKENSASETKAENSQWKYEQAKDELRETSAYIATLISSNTVDFGFPYNESSMDLILRKDPKYGNDVILSVNGQFNGCMVDSCEITVKFDNGKLESYRMVGSDGGDNSTIFLENAKSMKIFVDKLKNAKKLIVEANFYNYGKGQFIFDTQNLEWKHF